MQATDDRGLSIEPGEGVPGHPGPRESPRDTSAIQRLIGKARRRIRGQWALEGATTAAILAAAAALVKPGGRLVYGTCSLLSEENEDIVTEFLGANPDFKLVPAKEVLEKQGVKVAGTTDYLRLYPHVHDTDGFFAAVLERTTAKA